MGIEDSISFRSRNLSLGSGVIKSSNVINNYNAERTKISNVNFHLGYEDIYQLHDNNPHGFINYRSVRLFAAKNIHHSNMNLMDFDNLDYGIQMLHGIGYNFENYYLIPYSFRGSTSTTIEFEDETNNEFSEQFKGICSEVGLMLRLKNGIGLRVGYSTTTYSKDSDMFKRYTSVLLESGLTSLVGELLYSVAGNSELYPVFNIVGKSIIRFAYASLRRDEAYFPFNGANGLTANKFQVGFEYGLKLW